jgi:multidrug efflux pump subunit AcrB
MRAAIAVVGGLPFSQMMILYLTPVGYGEEGT